ncbi:Kinase [Hexamita inflata]|uniref:AGC n=1 Tax=Hexamita inflata TaxID=28002 RepID=A0AA86UCV5_9EUKA|nr:AGC [Hexamita inflata]
MGVDQPGSFVNNTPNIAPATTITDFQLIKVLGQGTFATVYLARRIANNQLYAVKVIKKSLVLQSNELEHTNAELKILSQLNHPNLIRLHGAFQNADNLYLVLDFMGGGELFHHLQKNKHFSERTTLYIIAQLILALQELHSKQIIMRDLKPENILFDSDGYVKITDFGLSKLQKTEGQVTGTTFCGTAEYLSPEQLRNQPHGIEVDYWAIGIIAYEMMAGIPPFYNKDHKVMFKLILKGEPKFSEKIFSQQAQLFIKQCLEKDPKKRLGSPHNNTNVKTHPWFNKLDWDKLYNKMYELEYVPQQQKQETQGNVDVSNFNPNFTQRQIDREEVMNLTALNLENQALFEGFDVDSQIVEQILKDKLEKAAIEHFEGKDDLMSLGCNDETGIPIQQLVKQPTVMWKGKRNIQESDDDIDKELSI